MKPMIEIFTEAPLLEGLFKVTIGSGDNPHVHAERLSAADPLELPLLEEPEELGLDLWRDVSDLVEEDGPPVGHLELALFELMGPRKSAALVAEEVAL